MQATGSTPRRRHRDKCLPQAAAPLGSQPPAPPSRTHSILSLWKVRSSWSGHGPLSHFRYSMSSTTWTGASGGTLSLRLCRGSPSKSKSRTDGLQRSRGAEGTPPRQAPPFSGHARSTGTFPGQGSSPSHGRGLSCRTDKARSLARRAPGGVWLSPGRSWSRSGCKELWRQDDQHSWPTPHVPRGALLPKPRRGRTSVAPRAPGAPLLGPEASGASRLTSWGWGAAASGFLPQHSQPGPLFRFPEPERVRL